MRKNFLAAFLLLISFSSLACSFERVFFIQPRFEKTPLELQKKILNEIFAIKTFLIKENVDLNLKICGSVQELKRSDDFAKIPNIQNKENYLLTFFLKDEAGQWKLELEKKVSSKQGKLESEASLGPLTAPKSVKNLSTSALLDWVEAKILEFISK
jgi:hypothetical protein